MEIKILEWNVGCSAGNKIHGRKDLESLFSLKPEYDILILTEFYRLHDYDDFKKQFENWGYFTFITLSQKNYNDVFIAISNKWSVDEKRIINPKRKAGIPNFLAIPAKIGEKEIAIIGTRFCGGYEDMREQFINFLPLINRFESAVIGGDFNNAKIHGDENTFYSERQIDALYRCEKNGIVKNLLQFDYNYHRIKLWLHQNDYCLVSPKEGFSFPRYKSKIDHFAIKGINVINVEYLPTKLSDHYQLFGVISL